jgi:S1-C subfamily serine protease
MATHPAGVGPLLGLVLAPLLPQGSSRAQAPLNPSLLAPPVDASVRAGFPDEMAARARRSLVHVFVEVDGPRGAFPIVRSTSGVVVGPDGLVLTWLRLVAEAKDAADKRILVQLDDAANTRLPARIAAEDPRTGLVLLSVTPPPGGLQPAAFAPDPVTAGEPVLVLCRPEGKEAFAFLGVASAAASDVLLGGQPFAAEHVLLSDARSDERCDGAPAFDWAGRLAGLYSSEHVQRDQSEPKLEDLKRPSYGVLVQAVRVRQAFGDLLPPPAPQQQALHPSAEAVRRAAPSVVAVFAGSGDFPAAKAADPGGSVRVEGLGSGVVLSRDGLVVCNAHVVSDGQARIRLHDGTELPAKVAAKNGPSNLCLLAVELPSGRELSPIDCAGDDEAIVGEDVLAIGRPYGAVFVSKGVVSARRDREGGRVQCDANLGNPNGGGAVIDATGRLLGVVDAGAVDPINVQYAMRGDRASTETNLSTFVGIGRIRRMFREVLQDRVAAAAAVEVAARRTPLSEMVAAHADAMLNVYVQKSVVQIDEDDPFASMKEPEFRPVSLGSGVLITSSGLALSNWHVVDDAVRPDGSPLADHRLTVRTYGGKTYAARALSISREDDLSLLQLELAPGESLPFVELGSSSGLRLGQPVAAIGNPHGRANTVTFGVVSATGQSIRVKGRFDKLGPLIETDAAINGGNSGGALLDMRGRLVGINSAGGGTFNNKGYAIEVDHVRRQFLSLLLSSHKLRSPELGMTVLDLEGKVAVQNCDPRGPAALAGVRAGDVVQSIAGAKVGWSADFALGLLAATPDAPLELELVRADQPVAVRVAPLPAAVWAVVRQTGLLPRDFPIAEDADRVRAAAVLLHRAFSGDPSGEPQTIPGSVVRIERVYAGMQREGFGVEPGDLLLALELRSDDGDPLLVRVEDVAALRDRFNDRQLGSYDGADFRCWIERDGEVRRVTLTARRLFW